MKAPGSRLPPRASDRLHSLERWRTAQLDNAQAAHARHLATVSERTANVAEVQGAIDESQNLARAHLAPDRILSVDSLTLIGRYTSAQIDELQQASASLAESRQAAALAHEAMCRKFEELAAVERLRARRRQEVAKGAARLDQKRLDDQALLRSAAQLADDAKFRRKQIS